MENKLVAYFSASGQTKRVAEKIADEIGCDVYEIKPRIPYEPGDLNWTDPFARSTREMKGQLPYPELADTDAPVAEVDAVILGFPIWWYVAPTIINKFLESYDFNGKKVVAFATSQVSGFGKTAESLKKDLSKEAELVMTKVFHSASDRELEEFAKELI